MVGGVKAGTSVFLVLHWLCIWRNDMELRKKAAYADQVHDSVEAEDAALSRAIAEGLKGEPVSIEEARKALRETDGDRDQA